MRAKIESQWRSMLANAKALMAKLVKFNLAFTLSSLFYCAVHWIFVHDTSIYSFLTALVFSAITASAALWLSERSTSSSTRSVRLDD
jgi:hypothetical protein